MRQLVRGKCVRNVLVSLTFRQRFVNDFLFLSFERNTLLVKRNERELYIDEDEDEEAYVCNKITKRRQKQQGYTG
jgi:hypothetical protein